MKSDFFVRLEANHTKSSHLGHRHRSDRQDRPRACRVRDAGSASWAAPRVFRSRLTAISMPRAETMFRAPLPLLIRANIEASEGGRGAIDDSIHHDLPICIRGILTKWSLVGRVHQS